MAPGIIEDQGAEESSILPFYPLLYIFSYCDAETFTSVKLLNKQFSRIYRDKCNEDDAGHGNISSELYSLRLSNWFNKAIVDFKPPNMTNRLYHRICNKHYDSLHNHIYLNKLCSLGHLFELRMLEIFGKMPFSTNLDEACSQGHLEIIKYFAPNILPTSAGATAAGYKRHTEIVEFLKLYNIYSYDIYNGQNNIAIGYNALAITGTNNIAIGYNALAPLVTTGIHNNVGIGYNALAALTTGTANVAF
mgnify:CR=1 FL=1